MPETIDTSRPFTTIPEGTNIVTITEVPLKKRSKASDNIYYEFKFGYVLEGKQKKWTAAFMPWDLGVLLSAMKFPQISEHSFEWDREKCMNRVLKVTIVHEPDSKDPKKFWPRIKQAEELPF